MLIASAASEGVKFLPPFLSAAFIIAGMDLWAGMPRLTWHNSNQMVKDGFIWKLPTQKYNSIGLRNHTQLIRLYKDRHAALFIKFNGETLGTAQNNRSSFSSVTLRSVGYAKIYLGSSNAVGIRPVLQKFSWPK